MLTDRPWALEWTQASALLALGVAVVALAAGRRWSGDRSAETVTERP